MRISQNYLVHPRLNNFILWTFPFHSEATWHCVSPGSQESALHQVHQIIPTARWLFWFISSASLLLHPALDVGDAPMRCWDRQKTKRQVGGLVVIEKKTRRRVPNGECPKVESVGRGFLVHPSVSLQVGTFRTGTWASFPCFNLARNSIFRSPASLRHSGQAFSPAPTH